MLTDVQGSYRLYTFEELTPFFTAESTLIREFINEAFSEARLLATDQRVKRIECLHTTGAARKELHLLFLPS